MSNDVELTAIAVLCETGARGELYGFVRLVDVRDMRVEPLAAQLDESVVVRCTLEDGDGWRVTDVFERDVLEAFTAAALADRDRQRAAISWRRGDVNVVNAAAPAADLEALLEP